MSTAAELDADEYSCTDIVKPAESICCGSGAEEEEEAAVTTEAPPADVEPVVTTPTPEIVDTGTSCSVCSGGLTVDSSVSLGGGRTCGGLIIDAQTINEDSPECAAMKTVEGTCCPPSPDSPCQVCVDGLTVEETVSLGGGRTCGGLLVDAAMEEEGSRTCDAMKGSESTCCPVTADNPCPFCATDGVTATDGNTGNVNCAELVSEALVIEQDTTACALIQDAEATCCPVITTPCAVCPDGGITVDGSTSLEGDQTCESLTLDALLVEDTSEECTQMKVDAAETCCPPEIVDPCTICATDGVTADDNVAPSDGVTCAEIVAEALLVETDSAQCAILKDATESVCCPLVQDPCVVCSEEGVTAADTAQPTAVQGVTCADVVAEALLVETETATCSLFRDAEATCCPSITNPCSVCAEGITTDTTSVVGEGKTCADLLVDAPLVETDSPECISMQDSELVCCPTAAVEPCTVCTEGITADETTPIGVGKQCGDLLVDALNVEESSDRCTTMKTLEATCCPALPSVSPVKVPTASPIMGSVAPTVTKSEVPTVKNVTTTPVPSVTGDLAGTDSPVVMTGMITPTPSLSVEVKATSAPNPSVFVDIRETDSPVAIGTELPVETEENDLNESCAEWAAAGECDANPVYMLVNCAASCANADESASPSLAPSFVSLIVTAIVSAVYLSRF